MSTPPDPTDSGSAHRFGWLRAHPLRTVLAAIVLGAIVCGGIVLLTNSDSDTGAVAKTDIGADDRGPAKNAFNQSVAGDCLTWPSGNPGKPSKIGCGGEHLFEVAGSIDTSVYPGSQFGKKAPWPGTQKFVALRDQNCPAQVRSYLNGRFDPNGRFSVGMMYPSQAQWDDGERTLRCGVQYTNSAGELMPFLGRVADQDQALQWAPGTCIGINQQTRQPTDPVDCAEQHAFQVTGLVNLGTRFGAAGSGRPWPTVAQQNAYLTSTCPGITNTFLGGRAAFTKTTLNVQWSTVSQVSWLTGTRTAVCYIGLPDEKGFATLVGDAKGGLLINGKVPAPPPAEPPGRLNPTPVPNAPGLQPNPTELPAPVG
ncbi:septum formation family protein [Williamsia phyllosphaerae]|nr:septum formation family protein [Williamsia phyllosphaerae]